MDLKCFFIIASIITFIFVIKKIRKHSLDIDDAIVWILWAILLLVFSVFPQIPTKISNLLGFMSPSNFIFCLFIFFLYTLLFFQNAEISRLKEKQKELIQKLSILDYDKRNGQEK